VLSLPTNRLLLIPLAVSTILPQSRSSPPPACRPEGRTVAVAELPEGSGVAASRRTPGVFWAHNDSGNPVILALDGNGALTGRVRLTGAKVEDWEDIAVGPCPQGTCVYVADVGDNSGDRDHITVYRAPEPGPGDAASAPVEVFQATYPDDAHDAEALFVTPQSEVFVITKGDPGPIALYRWPLQTGPTTLARIGVRLPEDNVRGRDRPTAADVSADGRWVVMRTTHYVAFYRTSDLISGRWHEASRVDVRGLGEPRGEGVAFAADGLVLVGEGGGSSRPGTFARLACTFPR
jgi:hypothetical protein